jgi:hypothetical protein
MTCAECATTGRRGYCAPLRCYCGHDTCHAFASYVALAPLNVTPIDKRKNRRGPSAWDERSEAGWIDKL